jgi:hypothetical protein
MLTSRVVSFDPAPKVLALRSLPADLLGVSVGIEE